MIPTAFVGAYVCFHLIAEIGLFSKPVGSIDDQSAARVFSAFLGNCAKRVSVFVQERSDGVC